MSREALALFPKEFFYSPRGSNGQCGTSPAAPLDPVAGYDSTDAFQSSTTPGAVKKPKDLILCGKTLKSFQQADIVALIDFLYRSGFTLVYKRCRDSPKVPDGSRSSCCRFLLTHDKLARIDQDVIYEEIYQKQRKPRNHLLLLDETRISDLFRCFEKSNQRMHAHLLLNPFKMTLRAPAIGKWCDDPSDEIYILIQEIVRGPEADILAFQQDCLNYIQQGRAHALIAQITSQYDKHRDNQMIKQRFITLIDVVLVRYPDFLNQLMPDAVIALARIHPTGIFQRLNGREAFLTDWHIEDITQLIESLKKIPAFLLQVIGDGRKCDDGSLYTITKLSHDCLFQLLCDKQILNRITRLYSRQHDALLWPSEIMQIYHACATQQLIKLTTQQIEMIKQYCTTGDHAIEHAELVYFHFPQLKQLLEKIGKQLYDFNTALMHYVQNFVQYEIKDRHVIIETIKQCPPKRIFQNPALLDAMFLNDALLEMMDRNTIAQLIFYYANPWSVSCAIIPRDWSMLACLVSRFIEPYQDLRRWIEQYYVQTKYDDMVTHLVNGTLFGKDRLTDITPDTAHSYFVKLISDMSFRRYFSAEILLDLARHDILLAKTILITYGDEYKSLFTREELVLIVQRYPDLFMYLKEELSHNAETTQRSCDPSVLEIDYDTIFLEYFPNDTRMEEFIQTIKKSRVHLEKIIAIRLIFTGINIEPYVNNIITMITVFKKQCKNLKYIYAPQALLCQLRETCSPEIEVCLNDCQHRGASLSDDARNSRRVSRTDDRRVDMPDAQVQESRQLARKLYVKQNRGDDNCDMSSYTSHDHVHYTMRESGEMLTQDITIMPGVRTAALSYRFTPRRFFHPATITKETMEPNTFAPVFTVLEQGHEEFQKRVAACKAATTNNAFCDILFTIALKKNMPTRLLSIDAQEKIECTNNADVQIARGSDHFFYVISPCDVLFSYIVRVDRTFLVNDAFQNYLPKTDPVRQMIDAYRDESRGFRKIADPKQSTPLVSACLTYQAWWKQLFDQRAGVCWHRSLAVYEQLCEAGYRERVQIVHINGNHVVLEVLHDKVWYRVDLGGGANATMMYCTAESTQISDARMALARETMTADISNTRPKNIDTASPAKTSADDVIAPKNYANHAPDKSSEKQQKNN